MVERRYSRRHQDNSTRSDRLARSLALGIEQRGGGRGFVLVGRDDDDEYDVVIKSAAAAASAAATKMVNF